MADDSRLSAGKTADLARVRDNQRRSRARRKEYLQELETKYRTCEQVGVGASAELQAAARQVASENKRLRQLLVKHGIPPNELNGDSSSVDNLDSMIGKRRACGGNISCEKSLAEVRQDYSQMPDQGLWPLQMRIEERQPSPQCGNHSSNGRSPMSATSTTSTMQQPESQPFACVRLQPSQAYTTLQPQTKTYATSLSSAENFYGHSPLSLNGTCPDYTQQQHNDLFGEDHVDASTATMDPYANMPHSMHLEPQHSSCRDIADAIRYVRPNVTQQELDDEMGCQPGGSDYCKVPNYEAFALIDRLSNGERR